MKDEAMFTVSLSTKDLLSQKVDCYAYIVEKDFNATLFKEITKNVCPDLVSILKKRKFTGSLLETASMPCMVDGRVAFCIIIGVGTFEAKGISLVERYRRALGQLVKEVRAC